MRRLLFVYRSPLRTLTEVIKATVLKSSVRGQADGASGCSNGWAERVTDDIDNKILAQRDNKIKTEI